MPIFLLIFWLITRDVKVQNVKEFFIKRGTVGAAGGIWAMLPDIDYFLEKPIIHGNVPLDIFFFHGTFDKVISETDLYFAGEMLLLFVVINFFAIAVVVESFKRLKEAMFGKKEEEEEEGEEGEEDQEHEVEEGEPEEELEDAEEAEEKEDEAEEDIEEENVEEEEEGEEE